MHNIFLGDILNNELQAKSDIIHSVLSQLMKTKLYMEPKDDTVDGKRQVSREEDW